MRGSTASHISLWRVIASFAVGFSAFIFVGDLGRRSPSAMARRPEHQATAPAKRRKHPRCRPFKARPRWCSRGRQNIARNAKTCRREAKMSARAHAQASQTRAPSLHRTMSTIHNATNAVIVPNDPTDTTIPVATVMEITPIVPRRRRQSHGPRDCGGGQGQCRQGQ